MKKIMGMFIVSLLLVAPNIVCMNDKPSIMGWWTIAGATAGSALGAGVGMVSAYSSLKTIVKVPHFNDLELLKKSMIDTTGNAVIGSVVTPIIIIGGLAAAGAIGGNAVGLIGKCASYGKETIGNDLNKNGMAGWSGAFVTGVTVASVAGICLIRSASH